MAKVIYFNKNGGAVLGCLEHKDPEYEKSLDRSGINWATMPGSVDPADLPRAAVRQGKVEVAR